MSIKTWYSVFDRAVQSFSTPFLMNTEQEAVRSFKNEINRVDSALGANPSDYELHMVGQFDDQTGTCGGGAVGVLVARAEDLVINKE